MGLSSLPLTQALTPDAFPAVIWKYFAIYLILGVYISIQFAWFDYGGILPIDAHRLNKSNISFIQSSIFRPIYLQYRIIR